MTTKSTGSYEKLNSAPCVFVCPNGHITPLARYLRSRTHNDSHNKCPDRWLYLSLLHRDRNHRHELWLGTATGPRGPDAVTLQTLGTYLLNGINSSMPAIFFAMAALSSRISSSGAGRSFVG